MIKIILLHILTVCGFLKTVKVDFGHRSRREFEGSTPPDTTTDTTVSNGCCAQYNNDNAFYFLHDELLTTFKHVAILDCLCRVGFRNLKA